jgi:SAM-dependent methyltransferase
VAAIDPSEPQVAACRSAVPTADVRLAGAEAIPFADATFDVTVSQLAINFMVDPVAGTREMRRVSRPGGTVAACTWDYREGMTMLRTFWDAAVAIDPSAPHEGRSMPYCTAQELQCLWVAAGLESVVTGSLTVDRIYASFDDFWSTFELGVGPGGTYCLSLDAERRELVRAGCFRALGEPEGLVPLTARAWIVSGIAP